MSVVRDPPLLLHVQNLDCGQHGPSFYTTNLQGATHPYSLAAFTPYHGEGASGGDYDEDQAGAVPNGPYIKINRVTYHFQFAGNVHDTNITIHVVRQKKMITDFWSDTRTHNFLPHTLRSFRNLAGFTANKNWEYQDR